MKCHQCKVKMGKVKGKMNGVEYEFFKCKKCGEELLDMQQLKELGKKHKKMRTSKEVTFAKWGNSLAIRIPKDIVDEFHLSPGKEAVLFKDKEGIRIIPS